MTFMTKKKKLRIAKRLAWILAAIKSFGGYAGAQLRRLDNKSMRSLPQAQNE